MRSLGETIARLNAGRMISARATDDVPDRLTPLVPTRNPGDLKAWCYAPDRPTAVPLVVVLHGCTQSAGGYDRASGWSALAERHGFAVLLPEQQRANNPNLCFNWFSPADARRDAGEAASIRAMVDAMLARGNVDPARVFATGLSAGGAMTAVLLACYPDVFAGGAVVAGLPYRAADTMAQAFERMRGQGHVDAERYATYVRDASDHRTAWPTLSVWHGAADTTVAPANADLLLGQWRSLHGCATRPDIEDGVDGAAHRLWRDPQGRVVVQDYRVPGMGHGTPLATVGARACGSPAPYMLDVGISSTWHIAAGWDILDTDLDDERHDASRRPVTVPGVPSTIQRTIDDALRSAGLMR